MYNTQTYEVQKDKGAFCLRCGWQEFRGGQEHNELRTVTIAVSDKGHDGSLAGTWQLCDDCLVSMHSWFGL